jgi:hypothetical protein
MPFSGFGDLDPRFAQSLQGLIAAQGGGGISPFSGFRSIERQRQLWEASDKSGHMVARPGHSQHNFGRAVDLRFADDAARSFAHANAAKYGLNFPMSYEPWHIEPIGARSSGAGDIPQTEVTGASTAPRAGPLAAPSTGFPSTSSGLPAGPEDSIVDTYQRPLPFEAGFGPQQFMEGVIGGTLRGDMRKAMFGRIAKLFI